MGSCGWGGGTFQYLAEIWHFMPPKKPRIFGAIKHVGKCPSPLSHFDTFYSCRTVYFPKNSKNIFPAPFVWSDVRGYVHCTSEFTSRKKSKKELKQIELQNAQGMYVCMYVWVYSSSIQYKISHTILFISLLRRGGGISPLRCFHPLPPWSGVWSVVTKR